MLVVGLDIAPTHSAAVALRQDDGPGPLRPRVVGHWYITTKKGVADRARDRSWLLSKTQSDKLTPGARRMVKLDNIVALVRTVQRAAEMSHEKIAAAGIEDYVFDSRSSGSHDAGGAGDCARRCLWVGGIPTREVPAGAVKRFVVHNYGAAKDQVQPATRRRWPELYAVAAKYLVGKDQDTFGDVIDAGWIARIVLVELMLRRGYLGFAELEHDQERIVYQGTTKNRARCILDTPFTERI